MIRGALAKARGLVLATTRVVHPLGWAFAVAGVAFGLAGWLGGWPEVGAIGTAMLACCIVAIWFTIGWNAYNLDLHIADHWVRVGERSVGQIAIRNTSRHRLMPAQVHVAVGESHVDFTVPLMRPGDVKDELFTIPTQSRAVVRIGPAQMRRGDPIGLLGRDRTLSAVHDLYVHPRTTSLDALATGLFHDLEGEATGIISDQDISFHALRDYVSGDDRRNIHWKSSARLGKLMVRQFEDTRRTSIAVGLACAAREYHDDNEFELAVSVAASIGLHAFERRNELAVVAQSGIRTDKPLRFLDACSALALADAGPGLMQTAALLANVAPEASLDVLVTGSVPDAASRHRARAYISPNAITVAIQCGSGTSHVQTRAGEAVIWLTRLDDLPRLLRRAVAE